MEKKGTLASPATARARRVLPVPGGPTSSHSFGYSAPQFLKFFRSFEKFDHFLEFFPGLIDSGHIGKRDLGIAFRENFGLAFGKDMTPIPVPIFFMANRQIRKKMPRGRIQDRRLLRNLFSCRPE
jgi:hypothetical protein